jgi:hypothetical protein
MTRQCRVIVDCGGLHHSQHRMQGIPFLLHQSFHPRTIKVSFALHVACRVLGTGARRRRWRCPALSFPPLKLLMSARSRDERRLQRSRRRHSRKHLHARTVTWQAMAGSAPRCRRQGWNSRLDSSRNEKNYHDSWQGENGLPPALLLPPSTGAGCLQLSFLCAKWNTATGQSLAEATSPILHQRLA